ncbi:T9SS type A sorting domain-containing protein [bacterium]|nr:MAG: T9SS type A sorting domain-containing protein [bacterium]
MEYPHKDGPSGNTSLLKSKDFRTWEPIFISDSSSLKNIKQIKFYDNIGIGIGADIFIVSSDNGETWVDLYDKKDTVLFDKAAPIGFAYLDDGYVYTQGFIYYIDDEGLKRARPKIFRYKLDFANTSVELELSSLKVYPNPAETEITINYDKVIKSINILDLTGKKLYSKEYLNGAKNISLDVDFLQSGTYFLNINDKIYKRFVKN